MRVLLTSIRSNGTSSPVGAKEGCYKEGALYFLVAPTCTLDIMVAGTSYFINKYCIIHTGLEAVTKPLNGIKFQPTVARD